MKLDPEESLQAECIRYARLFKDVKCVASLNGISWGKPDPDKPWAKKAYRDKLTVLGAEWGDPDLDTQTKQRFKAELKIWPNKPKEHQKQCMNEWMDLGVPCYVVYTFAEFKDLLDAARLSKLPAPVRFDVDLGDPIGW